MTIARADVPLENCWNVEYLFPDINTWEQAYARIKKDNSKPVWPEIQAFKGQLHKGPETIKQALEQILTIDREITKLYTYTHLRHDEDIANDKHKQAYNQATSLYHEFVQEVSWFEPELLSLPDEEIQKLMTSPIVADYRFYLEKVLRMKKHTLSPDQEEILALAGEALQATSKAYSAINDADFKFGSAVDSKGEAHTITHASYGIYVRSHDRTLREDAFKKMHGTYRGFQNTLCELLSGQVKAHIYNMKARKYSSCLEAALFPKNIQTEVYHSLVKAVNEDIHVLHKYFTLREKVMNIGPLHLYDMNVPLTKEIDIKMPYAVAEEVIIESVAPLGAEYQNLLRKGLKDDRWVDRFENENKRSGGYSSCCYDSLPYILMNYKELLRDVFTLAHEAGHSMHSLLSNKTQPYQYADYPIFLAEVASTFNEDLLTRLLLERANSKEEKIFLLNQKIEDIRSTLFRQTMFAEFELFIHDSLEKGCPITPDSLNEEFKKLNMKYFGNSVIIDDEIKSEWARIPHFYYNFYVYQYATGISAALALSDRVVSGGDREREDYLNFLKSGSSRYPIDTLKLAGVDMCSTEPVKSAIRKFDGLIAELDALF